MTEVFWGIVVVNFLGMMKAEKTDPKARGL